MSMEAELCRWSTYDTMLSNVAGRSHRLWVPEIAPHTYFIGSLPAFSEKEERQHHAAQQSSTDPAQRQWWWSECMQPCEAA